MKRIRHALSRVRYHIRRQPIVGACIYAVPNLLHSVRAAMLGVATPPSGCGKVALCLRFRDEAPFLAEWMDYYLLAGVSHFFLYNNNSIDGYANVLTPYVQRGVVTLIDWPRVPASPDAEHDCIQRTRGRYSWVGFLDADEFVVIRSGQRIDAYLADLSRWVPAIALHWYYFGSNGHEARPENGVVQAYTRRAATPNAHFKVFVRPEQVTRNRNSHNFYYRRAKFAIREDGSLAYGSMAHPPTGVNAWVNHYYCKSLQDYMEKAARKSTLDRSGINDPSRTLDKARRAMQESNDVVDLCAVEYLKRLRAGQQQ